MSNSLTLKEVISLLKSDKSKERQQGISALRDTFGRREVVQSLDAKRDGRAWLTVFQALFTTVVNERAVVLKKGKLANAAPATVRRLEDTVATVRWLVERSVTEWNAKVCKALVKHLLQTMVYSGKLFAPVALHYIKALRVICSYAPHLERLQSDEDEHISILSLAFNAVLGDNLKSSLDDEPEGMSEDEVIEELSDGEGEEPSSSRKRRRSPERHRTKLPQKPRTVSLEQIEFVAIIAIILCSPRVQLLHPSHPFLPQAVLDRLRRFFALHSADTSAHVNMTLAMNSTLETLSLNCRDIVTNFGIAIWDNLLSLWSTKNRELKECVLATLTTLFPFVTQQEAQFDISDGVGRLLRFLHGEHDARWGFEALSFDAIRLEVTDDDIRKQPFTANTFRHGFNFTASQVVAWTVLELQGNCMKELYILSESTLRSTPSTTRSEGKRVKLTNPVADLLQTIQRHQGSAARSYYLQCLIFFIDHHWSVLHAEIRTEVANALLQIVTVDDAICQSWVFCCLAALSYADSRVLTAGVPIPKATQYLAAEIQWESIWSHTMRRTNASAISRAACHTAHILLYCEKVPTNRVLTEMEAMIQDISVQGPAAPYDSVCAFLSRCLKIASQDAKLYRMHLDDKVLSWLAENWSSVDNTLRSGVGSSVTSAGSSGVVRMEQYNVQDVLTLLQSACGLTERSFLVCPMLLPDHFLVELHKDRLNTAVIRDFLLNSELPPPHRTFVCRQYEDRSSKTTFLDHSSDLSVPAARERKASASLLKLLDALTTSWESRSPNASRPTAESTRYMLDTAILAICFESLLVMNGIRSNRRTLLVACKMIASLLGCLNILLWTPDEIRLLFASFQPLTRGKEVPVFADDWQAILEPGSATGISLKSSVGNEVPLTPDVAQSLSRRRLQSIIWQSADVQDALGEAMNVFRKALQTLVSGQGHFSSSKTLMAVGSMVANDDKDDFAPIRITQSSSVTADFSDTAILHRRHRDIAAACFDMLAVAPILQSTEGYATRDKSLADLACDAINNESFDVVLEPFLHHVYLRNIHLGQSMLDKLFESMGDLLKTYKFGQSEDTWRIVVLLLSATAQFWLSNPSSETETVGKAQYLYRWLLNKFRKVQVRSWRTRDTVVRFLDRFLLLDPRQRFFTVPSDDVEFEMEDLPGEFLPTHNRDEDIRVRFSAAISSARLFSTSYTVDKDAMQIYDYVRSQLCIVLANYEQILTRMLCLGNLIITSSAVRRGPFWHILEICLHQPSYVRPAATVLNNAAAVMGLRGLIELFEAYASQIAYSIRISGLDFFRLAPSLLGYETRRECAEATFHSFAPTNLLVDEPSSLEHGRKAFEKHCLLIGMSSNDALRSCFAEIVGYQIVSYLDMDMNKSEDPSETHGADLFKQEADGGAGLMDALGQRLKELGSPEILKLLMAENVDGIAFTILRTIGDFDYNEGGNILRSLNVAYGGAERVSRAFRSLMKFRAKAEFMMHSPNLPLFPANSVLFALKWLSSNVAGATTAGTVYHVLHSFFAEVSRCPLINEQLRLLTGLCLYISINYALFKNAALLRALLNGSVNLFSNQVLSGFAQGILDWTFIHLRELQCDSPHLSSILIRIGTIARDFCQSTGEETRSTGARLKSWIEGQLESLYKVEAVRGRVVVALAAWPDELPEELTGFTSDLTSTDLSRILDDPHLPAYKFKVVRRLAATAVSEPSYLQDQFSRHDFWRLKDSIPSAHLADDEASAFMDLLISSSGQVRSHSVDRNYGRSIGTRHQRFQHDKGKRSNPGTIKRPIAMALLDLLADHDPNTVYVAYRTLRLVASTDPFDSPEYGSWPLDYRGDVSLVNFCPLSNSVEDQGALPDILGATFYEASSDFFVWIARVTVFFSGVLSTREPFYSHLKTILQTNATYAEQMFPVLVHSLLQSDYDTEEKQQSLVNRDILSQYFSKVLSNERTDVRTLLAIVNAVLHLRNYYPGVIPDVLIFNKWLDLDFMMLSRCAITCGAYTTALLFLELAAENSMSKNLDDPRTEQILFDIYSHIEEPDGFYGIKTQDYRSFLLRRFHHEKQWDKALHFHGAGFESADGDFVGTEGILRSFHAFGFNKLAMSTLESLGLDGISSGGSSDLGFQLGWRTETWDLPDLRTSDSPSSSLYTALRAIHRERDMKGVESLINSTIWKEMQRLRELGNENLAEIRQVTMCLMSLAQIKGWITEPLQFDLASKKIDLEVAHWRSFHTISPNFEFADLESILATRISLIKAVRQREQREQIGTMLSGVSQGLLHLEVNCLLRLADAARAANEPQIALNSIVRAQQLERVPTFAVSDEYASVLWLQREQKFAVEFLKSELRRREQTGEAGITVEDKLRDACILARLGEWSSEAGLEKADYIRTDYFAPAIELLTNSDGKTPPGVIAQSSDTRSAVFYKCALFAEKQYQTIVNSSDIVRLKVYAERKRQELAERNEGLRRATNKEKQKELTQFRNHAQKLYERDSIQILEVTKTRDDFLKQAVQMLSLSLQSSDVYDEDASVRFCSLWFANFATDALVHDILSATNRIPSRKLVFLAHQLSARLSKSSKKSPNQTALQSVLLRMCYEHPFHSLYQVYSLRSSTPGSSSTRRRSGGITVETFSQHERANAAMDIFDRLRNGSSSAHRISNLEFLCDAYLEWAKYPIKGDPRFTDRKMKPFLIPNGLKIKSILDLNVPVTTARTALDPTMRYENCVWIKGYAHEFDTAGGVNLPKISLCRGSDGNVYKQLFKGEGNDDLRQDAVMEQVFDLCNQVLRRDRESRNRELSIRSYKVIPLASQAGILEFVGNTIPMGNWLISAHARYHPKDLSHTECNNRLRSVAADTNRDQVALVQQFNDCRKHFHPVLRHFFTERHKVPLAWFEMRLKYARSAATTSIVGHILGLGDRHTQNILLDNATGEVIHIDLGIAFEQGTYLPVPERVPFRLTADVVDGLGISGTEGVFRRCAEETLRVLRDGSGVIKTVLEVFKHDPLHSWTASAIKIRKAQGGSSIQLLESERLGIGIDMESGTEDEAADRALSGVARKLDPSLSVEYVVNELISDATDVKNLALMFPGWAPLC